MLGVFRIVTPEVPLNPTNGPVFLLNHEYVRWLSAIDARSIFRLDTRQIEVLIPPHSYVGSGEPFLKQREIASRERPK